MKKTLIFCMTLMVMSACVKHPEIYKLLPAEEAAAIPYQMGQTVNFVNQHGDTLTYTVVLDETHLFNGEYYNFYHGAKMKYIPVEYCYARSVNLKCEQTSDMIGFMIIPGKELFIYWNGGLLADFILYYDPTETLTLGETTYENVHSGIFYSSQTGELIHEWHYSEEVGLISAKTDSQSLMLIP